MLQRTAMMALGYFVFMRATLPYQNTSREMSWKHPQNSVVGAMPRTQFTGKESETMEISGDLYPEITGGKLSLLALEMMAEEGVPYPLISGADFMIQGWFVITNIRREETVFFPDGTPRKMSFTLSLQRVDDSILGSLIDSVDSFL